MTDTALSPRLRHLLIREDQHGRLLLPDPRPSYPGARPPAGAERRVSDLSRLLNEGPTARPAPLRMSPPHHTRPSPPRPATAYPTAPMTAPVDRTHYHTHEARPELPRRHSSTPYEINPITNRIVYREYDFSPIGSRAPISRTTKACNACRSRKVRCDAGGGAAGTEPVTCSRCKEAGVECVYSGVQKKRGPCPGTTRPSLAQRRRGSQKSLTTDSPIPPTVPPVPAMTSKSSVQSMSVSTPPDISPPRTARSSYGFRPRVHIAPLHSSHPPAMRSARLHGEWSRPSSAKSHGPMHHAQHYPVQQYDQRDADAAYAHHRQQHRTADRMFAADYSMGTYDLAREHHGGSERNLPPLRAAVDTARYEPPR